MPVRRKEPFALESTLSSKTYIHMPRETRLLGYRMHLNYLWLPKPIMAIARVREHVKKGRP